MSLWKTKPKRRLLRGLSLDRVDLVDAGANPGADISLFKSESSTNAESAATTSATSRRTHVPRKNDPNPPEKTAEELQAELDAANEAREAAESAKDEAEGKLTEAEEKLSGTPEAELAEVKEELAAAKAELEKSKDADVQKALDETKDELDKLKKAERHRTFVAKAAEFDNLGGTDQIATVLEEADEHLSKAANETLTKVLKAANEQAEASDLFKRLSNPDAEGETAEARLEKAAKDKVAASDGKLTIEQAKVEVMHEDPDLAKDYRESARS